MTEEYQLRVLPEIAASEQRLKEYLSKEKGLTLQSITATRILKRSIDARQRTVFINLKVRVYINEIPTDNGYEETIYNNVEGKPQVTFRAPAEGVNGGYIDVENLRYRIVRDPGSEMLTESLTDTVYVDSDDLSLALYRYTVTTLSGDMESESVTSNALVFGSALGLPYETSMDSADEMALWTIVDANNDTKSWVYDATEKEMKYTAYSAADDWLFTPPFEARTVAMPFSSVFTLSSAVSYHSPFRRTRRCAFSRPSAVPEAGAPGVAGVRVWTTTRSPASLAGTPAASLVFRKVAN